MNFAEENDYRNLAVNLAASLIWAVLGVIFWEFIVTPIKKNRAALSRLTHFRHSGQITICYGIMSPKANSVYYTAEEGDVAGLNYADATLSSLYGRKRVRAVNSYVARVSLNELQNVVSISGPKWNRATEVLIGRLGSPITFDKTDSLVVQKRGTVPTSYQAVRRLNGDEQTCYGFVCSGQVKTPEGRTQNVVVCAGLNTLSTYGSVVFLMSLRELYSFRKYPSLSPRRTGKKWAVVIRVENTSNPNTSGPQREPLDPNQIEIDVIEVIGETSFLDPYVYRF